MMMRYLPALFLAVLFALSVSGHTYFFHLTEQVSISGFSAIETMVHTLKPENFVRDFSNGNASGASHTLLTHLYVPVHQLTGLPGITILYGMIALEIASVIGAAWILWWTLIRTSPSQEFRLGLFCWLATMLVSGYVVRPNLSNFGYPFFHGQFYGFADATAMLAIAAMLRGRWAWVAGMLCLGFMIHPTKTLVAAAFVGGATLAGGRDAITLKSMGAGFVTAAFAAAWAYFWLGVGHGDAVPPIPQDQYIAYTRGWQYHWYPIDRGLLSTAQYDGVSPFLAMQLMGLLAMVKSDLPALLRRQWLGGLAMLACLTLAGLWFSYSLTSVFMIKMALHRASELMTVLAVFMVMCAMYHQWRQGRWGWVIFFVSFLLGGMVTPSAFSAVIVALAIGIYFRGERKTRPLFSGAGRLADMALAGAAVAVLVFAVILGLMYREAGSPWTPVIQCTASLLVIYLLFRSKLIDRVARLLSWQYATVAWMAISCGFFLTAGYYLHHRFAMSDEDLAQARDYYAVEQWANANTPKDALFMVDPCQAYGWREFSERSSIGTAFEWFHTGWLYVSDGRVFNRGQSIRKTLQLDFDDKLPKRGERAKFINFPVCEMARDQFYNPSLAPQRRMATEQGVDYFVMESARSEGIMAANRLTPVFANSHYRVFVAKDLLQ